MEIHEQFFNQIAQAKRILIVLPDSLNADIAGAGTALSLFLGRQNKEVDILAKYNYESEFTFLPKVPNIKTVIPDSQSLVVVLNTQEKGLEEISYQMEENKTKIFLKSKSKIFSPEDLTFEKEFVPYDLVIIIGVEQLSELGDKFENYSELLYNSAKINIDNQPSNKHFGAINIVDINCASLCEVVSNIIQSYETDLVNEDIATSLLSGIIARTHSFQHPQINPKSFIQAGVLIEKGARQQDIVKDLFKTRPLAQLKLFGRVLAKLKFLNNSAYAIINSSDMEKAQAEESVLPKVFKDLLENVPNMQFVAMLVEINKENLKLVVAQKKGLNQHSLIEEFGDFMELKLLVSGPYKIFEFNLVEEKIESIETKLNKFLV